LIKRVRRSEFDIIQAGEIWFVIIMPECMSL